MGLLSNRIARDALKPGDHIYSWRAGYVYSHHDNYIVSSRAQLAEHILHLQDSLDSISVRLHVWDEEHVCCNFMALERGSSMFDCSNACLSKTLDSSMARVD